MAQYTGQDPNLAWIYQMANQFPTVRYDSPEMIGSPNYVSEEQARQNDLNQFLFGYTDPQFAMSNLNSVNPNIDWQPFLAQAMKEEYDRQGMAAFRYGVPPTYVVNRALTIAAEQTGDPQIAQAAQQTAPGTAWWEQNVGLNDARRTAHRESAQGNRLLVGSVLAGGALAGYLGGGTGSAVAGGAEAGGAAAWEGLGGLYSSQGASMGGAGATAGAGTGAASAGGGGIDWASTIADSGTTMTDVSPGLWGDAAMYEGGGLASELAMGSPEAAGMFGLSPVAEGTALGSTTGATTTLPGEMGAYQFPWYDTMKTALGTYLANQRAKDLQGATQQAADRADPFFAERPHYQQQFRGLTSTPSAFFDDPAIADIIGHQQSATERRLAAQGYNMSGNFANEVARTGQREAFGQYMPYTRMIGEAAGAFQGTQGAGQIMGAGAQGVSNIQGQRDAGLGAILETIYRGQQPTSGQQTQGQQPNKNLYEHIFL